MRSTPSTSATRRGRRRAASSDETPERSASWESQRQETFMALSLELAGELAQEPEVPGREVPDLLDAVAHHRQAVDAEAEREARPLRGVDPARAQDVRVDQAAAEEFHPARPLADRAARSRADEAAQVELERRLGEREERRPQPDLDLLAEDLGQQFPQRRDEVPDVDLAVDDDALDLVERVLVRRVERLVSEHAADRDGADRRLARLHGADLDRRRVCAQEAAVLEPRRVLVVARGMVARDVEGLEVVVLVLDPRPVENLETHREAGVLEFAAHRGDGVDQPAARRLRTALLPHRRRR